MFTRIISLSTACLFALSLASTAFADETPKVTASVEQPAPKSSPTAGWFRVDTDSLQTQVWLGATHSLDSVNLASDIYVVGALAELDFGPSFSLGNITLTPMVGVCFDFENANIASVIAPQLYTIYNGKKLYFESWIQSFFNSPFDSSGQDSVYTRNFLLYKATKDVYVGPQAELSYRINAKQNMFSRGLTSLPVGMRVNLGYGANNTLGVFLGYETKAAATSDGVAGRFTFIRNW